MARATTASKQATRHMNVPRKEITAVTAKPIKEEGRANFKANVTIADGKVTKQMFAG